VSISREFKPGDPAPTGYNDWQEWADVQEKAGIHQELCPTCYRWLHPQEWCPTCYRWLCPQEPHAHPERRDGGQL